MLRTFVIIALASYFLVEVPTGSVRYGLAAAVGVLTFIAVGMRLLGEYSTRKL